MSCCLLTWPEKDGTVTNSERCISRQRAALPPPGMAKPDWWIICEVAKRLGFADAFSYASAAEIFREHAALSAFENDGQRDFDIRGLIEADYRTMAPTQWPVRHAEAATPRLFADGRFFHPDGRARFVAVTPRPPGSSTSRDWPLILNTGRTRDHWHTMTRSGTAARLCSHEPEPWLSLHPADAARFGLEDGCFAHIESRQGSAVLRVRCDPAQREGEVFAPMHWNGQFAGEAAIGRLVAAITDPLSGQPEFKFTAARVAPVPVTWEATLLARRAVVDWEPGLLWSRTAGAEHTAYRLAGSEAVDWPCWVRRHLGSEAWIEYRDSGIGAYRAVALCGGRLEAAIGVGPAGSRPAMDWLPELFCRAEFGECDRASLLLGSGMPERRAAADLVCICHQVGRAAIAAAIADHGLVSVDQLGAVLGAGTGCGSCVPELRRQLRQAAATQTAQPAHTRTRADRSPSDAYP
jgi:assimilatory nitrate reductase catalytic subunit